MSVIKLWAAEVVTVQTFPLELNVPVNIVWAWAVVPLYPLPPVATVNVLADVFFAP